MNHTMACFGYGHRIYQRQLGNDAGATKKAWTRIYHHRGLAIRELGQVIAKDDTRCTDVTIATVVLLLVTEVLVSDFEENLSCALLLILDVRCNKNRHSRTGEITRTV